MPRPLTVNANRAKRPLTSRWLNRMTAAAFTLALGVFASSAHADFKALAQKVPASANAVVAINIAKLQQTPYAKSEQWTAGGGADAWTKGPVMVPPGSTRVLMASEVQSSMEPIWEMSLIEMENMPTLQAIAQAEGGNIDRVWDKDAVASPINAYFVPLDGKTLASITPANRSAIAKWVRTPVKPEGNVTSPYIKNVLAGLGEKTDIVFALDLEGAFSVPNIRRWLDENEIKELKETQLDETARLLGTMKGIALTVTVDQDASGRAVVEFDRDAAALPGDAAKSIMIGVLNTAGMRIDDVKEWKFVTAGKQVTMEGKLSSGALRKLLSIVQSPIPAATVASGRARAARAGAQTAGAAGGGSIPSSPAEASQRYFKVISANLDNFRAGTSPSESAMWARATAKRIDQLPILNVDPMLVDWAGMVSTRLKQAAAGAAIGQTQMNARVAGVMDPSYSTYGYDDNGNYQTNSQSAEYANAKSQRRQAALEQKAQAQQQSVQIMTEISESRPKIRAAMVEKYKVEF